MQPLRRSLSVGAPPEASRAYSRARPSLVVLLVDGSSGALVVAPVQLLLRLRRFPAAVALTTFPALVKYIIEDRGFEKLHLTR